MLDFILLERPLTSRVCGLDRSKQVATFVLSEVRPLSLGVDRSGESERSWCLCLVPSIYLLLKRPPVGLFHVSNSPWFKWHCLSPGGMRLQVKPAVARPSWMFNLSEVGYNRQPGGGHLPPQGSGLQPLGVAHL